MKAFAFVEFTGICITATGQEEFRQSRRDVSSYERQGISSGQSCCGVGDRRMHSAAEEAADPKAPAGFDTLSGDGAQQTDLGEVPGAFFVFSGTMGPWGN
eukprot:scaffold2930_cov51-Prasinocladus_malaysianus.AAC.1